MVTVILLEIFPHILVTCWLLRNGVGVSPGVALESAMVASVYVKGPGRMGEVGAAALNFAWRPSVIPVWMGQSLPVFGVSTGIVSAPGKEVGRNIGLRRRSRSMDSGESGHVVATADQVAAKSGSQPSLLGRIGRRIRSLLSMF